ncbi:MAG: hypothetical protein JWN74_3330 [Acidobacteriaceae bacterium]|nr:hypothetical protein [Acidobacteriaceae bacterium]
MAILNTAARLVLKPVPRFISPKGHAIIDYMTIGSFFMSAAWFWSRSKRAALAAAICGGAELAISLITDYPGGMKKAIAFRIHGDIDLGLATMTAAMPEFLAFEDDHEKKFFLAQGAMITAVRELTKFSRPSLAERTRRTTKAA